VRRSALATILLTLAGLASDASAVIVYGPQGRNLSAPTGPLANTGWQYFGRMSNTFSGWPIGPKHFLTAAHVGGGAGTTLTMPDGSVYTAISRVGAGGDLAVFEISGTFPTWAPVWNDAVDGSEIGRDAMLFGRGLPRGNAIYYPLPLDQENNPSNLPTGPTPTQLPTSLPPRTGLGPTPQTSGEFRGYEWFLTHDYAQSWGTNTPDGVVTDTTYGQLLYFNFTEQGGPNEAALNGNDSGGAVFVKSPSGTWKLAGIHLGVDGPFSYTPNGPLVYMSVTDARGLWYQDGANRYQVPFDANPLAGASYSTRVAALRSNLSGYIGSGSGTLIPEPTMLASLGAAGVVLLRRR
jgi:hypothetical protein